MAEEIVPPVRTAGHLGARSHFTEDGPAGLAPAQASIERALARDPGFALAFDSLAEAETFPFLDPVRSDPRYTALLRRMHLA